MSKTFSEWVNGLPTGDGNGKKLVIVDNGVSKQVTGNAAGGPAILDANGHVISRLAYEGVADGVATLDANGAVEQDPASKGQANGVAGLDANGIVAQRVIVGHSHNWGSSSVLSTTSSYSSNPVTELTSDDLAVPTNGLVLVQADIILRNRSASNYVVLAVGFSTDGGSNWTIPNHWITLAQPVKDLRIELSLTRWATGQGGQTIRFRPYFGTASGNVGDTIEAHAVYRYLAVSVWR